MTLKHAKVLTDIRSALDSLSCELNKPASERIAETATLNAFVANLERMASDIENGVLPPESERRGGMGRVITDGWPLASSLGDLIIRAENGFLNL